jgi:hypothetical protein
MIQKGTEQYRQASKIANEITKVANYERWNNKTLYDMFYNDFYNLMGEIIKLNVFASKIAKTIDDNAEAYSSKIAKVSSKQAWILACAVVENKIEFNL